MPDAHCGAPTRDRFGGVIEDMTDGQPGPYPTRRQTRARRVCEIHLPQKLPADKSNSRSSTSSLPAGERRSTHLSYAGGRQESLTEYHCKLVRFAFRFAQSIDIEHGAQARYRMQSGLLLLARGHADWLSRARIVRLCYRATQHPESVRSPQCPLQLGEHARIGDLLFEILLRPARCSRATATRRGSVGSPADQRFQTVVDSAVRTPPTAGRRAPMCWLPS